MTDDLKKFISSYVNLPGDELEYIAGKFLRRRVKKNEFILQEGEVCKDLVFVQDGCLRLFYIKDEVDVSVWFSFKHTSAIDIYGFISQTPSKHFIQAIEDSEILYLPKTVLNMLYESHPKMQEMMRKFLEDVLINLIDRYTAFQRDSAEQRYLNLLSKPAYLQKIPQKYLASFIGVTPTSLSRIRKQLFKNH